MTVEAGQRGALNQLLLHPIAPETLAEMADGLAAKGWDGDDLRALAAVVEDLGVLVDDHR